MMRRVQKCRPAAQKPALTENANGDISLSIAQIHSVLQSDLTFSNDAYPIPEITLSEERPAWLVHFDMAKLGDLLNVSFTEAAKQLRLFQSLVNFWMIHR